MPWAQQKDGEGEVKIIPKSIPALPEHAEWNGIQNIPGNLSLFVLLDWENRSKAQLQPQQDYPKFLLLLPS